jgi:alkylated DNA repair dioxygenase AlkB
VNPNTDPTGNIASLILIRLAKQCISLDNSNCSDKTDSSNEENPPWKSDILADGSTVSILKSIVNSLAVASSTTTSSSQHKNPKETLDPLVEGTKALAILARLVPGIIQENTCQQLFQSWEHANTEDCASLEPHQLSGLHWAYQCFHHMNNNNKDILTHTKHNIVLPDNLHSAYRDLNLPFQILPGCFEREHNLSVENLIHEVAFQVDTIKTTSKQVVPERRQTAWQGDDGVAPFEYSGKAMPRMPWSPLVLSIRNGLVQQTGQYYDGCLLNLYPDGGSAMRYHIDPDQGTLWDYATAIVSVGATRRVAFRGTNPQEHGSQSSNGGGSKKPHNFVVMHGDVMEMVDDCQVRFQHAVKPAENKREQAARSSLVFKRSLKG